MKTGGTMPVVLNATVAAADLFKKKISFIDIPICRESHELIIL